MVKRRVPDWEKKQLALVPWSWEFGVGMRFLALDFRSMWSNGKRLAEEGSKDALEPTKDMTVLFKLIFGCK